MLITKRSKKPVLWIGAFCLLLGLAVAKEHLSGLPPEGSLYYSAFGELTFIIFYVLLAVGFFGLISLWKVSDRYIEIVDDTLCIGQKERLHREEISCMRIAEHGSSSKLEIELVNGRKLSVPTRFLRSDASEILDKLREWAGS